MQLLIDKELNSTDKILKPDFNSKSGRELLAFYLQTKFRQIFLYDKKQDVPIINAVNPDFVNRFSRRLINNPTKRLLIGVTGNLHQVNQQSATKLKMLLNNYQCLLLF